MDSLVDILMRLWTSKSGNRGSVPGGRGGTLLLLVLIYLFTYLLTSKAVDRFWIPHKPHLRGAVTGVKRPESEGEQSPASCDEI